MTSEREDRRVLLWWIANILGLLVVIPLVIHLAHRVIREAMTTQQYAREILTHGVGITANLEPVPALENTAQLSARVKSDAVAYVTALNRLA